MTHPPCKLLHCWSGFPATTQRLPAVMADNESWLAAVRKLMLSHTHSACSLAHMRLATSLASPVSAPTMWCACPAEEGAPPPALTLPLAKAGDLRYGENPHQPAAFYADQSLAEVDRGGVASASQHHGKEVLPAGALPAFCLVSGLCHAPL